MRKWIRRAALTLAAALTLGALGGCAEKAKTPTVRIGVALYQQDDTFISTVVQSLEQAAREEEQERGIKINLNIVDGRSTQAVQNEQIDRFLDQGYDAICVNIVDRTAAAVLIDKAQRAEVPVIFFNREPVKEDLDRWEGAYYVGIKADAAGWMQGDIVLKAWQRDTAALDRNGDGVLQYVMLEGEPGHQDALLRTECSVKTLSYAGVPTEKLANAAANWQRGQASSLTDQWLEEFGERIEVVFSNNDDMALGAIDACLGAGMTAEELPFIVGVDATPPALEAVKEGTLQGTVRNDGEGEARELLALTMALADGKDPADAVALESGKYVWLQYATVTKENLADFLPPEE